MRERIVLTTKTFNPMSEGADSGLAPARIRRQIATSLERLGVDAVDLYLPHAMDEAIPVAETVGAFEELVAEGSIRAYGGSNVDAAWLEEALRHGRPDWVQNSHSLLERDDETGVLPDRGPGGSRLHAVQPARRRLADGEVPARRGAAGRAHG